MIPYWSVESFKIGPMIFFTGGFFISLAFAFGLFFALKEGKKIGIEANKIVNLAIFVFVGALAGSRLFFVLQQPLEFFQNPLLLFEINRGGLMFYGGLFGGLCAAWLYLKKEKFLILAGRMAPFIVLSLAVGRLGCLLLNDHQGNQTFLPWAVEWFDGTARHPVAIYLILFDLALFVFLLWYRKKAKGNGQNFLMFLFLYAAGRFLLDFTRDPLDDPHFLGLASSQWISILLLTLSIFLLVKIKTINLFKSLRSGRI